VEDPAQFMTDERGGKIPQWREREAIHHFVLHARATRIERDEAMAMVPEA